MEQEDSISFTSVVAGLLLLQRCVTSTEIVNFLSRLSCEDIEVNDIEDGMDDLLQYVCIDVNYSYLLKNNLEYDTILYENVTVHEFLENYVDKRILNVIQKDSVYYDLYKKNCPNCKQTSVYSNLSTNVKQQWKMLDVFKKIRKRSKTGPGYSFLESIR